MPPNVQAEDALRVSIDVWHPDCWVIQTTETVDIGFLGYGIFTTGKRATTLFTAYADTQAIIDRAVEEVRSSESVYSVSEMTNNYRFDAVPTPGNATRELLVTHDGRDQISSSFTSREFVLAAPIDMKDGIEQWTLLTNNDRDTVQTHLDEIRAEQHAEITVTSITQAEWTTGMSGLPISRLSRRQLEVFQLAQERGYYDWPKQASVTELADELGITASTVHEHLHKAEAKLLGQLDAGNRTS